MLDTIIEILPLIIPILVIDIGFRIYAIIDIINVERLVKGGNKIIWILVIGIINFGWLIYFIFGKDE